MNVASKDLCEQLYELSGWGKTDFVWQTYRSINVVYVALSVGGKLTPAYDLGYLIDKLPKPFSINIAETMTVFSAIIPFNERGKSMATKSELPADAACKLAIELFKSNILTREGK